MLFCISTKRRDGKFIIIGKFCYNPFFNMPRYKIARKLRKVYGGGRWYRVYRWRGSPDTTVTIFNGRV